MDRNIYAAQLRKSLIYTFLLGYLLTFITIMVVFSKEAGSLEGNQGITLFCLIGFVWVLCLTLLSTTIFFNLFPEIKNNRFYNFLSYYALPVSACSILIFTNSVLEIASVYLSITLPFFAVHSFFFYRQMDSN
ncbi:hypothetical protein GWR56_06010 [Mucilaginibacter sp. 14171R-50]|uniref:hypothetical protein n=1 Tax=Mucilaginibacter sp. 14171R-50 TaxID=2703789 RepID=UPI00138D5D8B|nr:hypothetical protein [Mucilaginibacter sp. 14171R-50]QHS55114.1 hypothetical protein GWR56_06010 [Mucilaginibacter sp. 14171R-50]